MNKVLASGKVQGLVDRTVLIARAGTERPIEDSAAPVMGDEGKSVSLVLVSRDVSAKRTAGKALAAGEEFSRRIIESSPDCLKVMDLDGRLLPMDEAGCRPMEIDDLSTIVGKAWGDCRP